MQKIQGKKVLGYMMLPGIVPRAKELFASGFGYTAFLMANIYNMVRLLPRSHPYLNPQNIGQFGLRHVIAEAANNLVLSKKNIDQIVVFTALLAAIVILFVQILLLAYGILFGPALAQTGLDPEGGPLINMFATVNPLDDIALNMLDRVFGIPEFFCNGDKCTRFHIAQGLSNDNVLSFHAALHDMFHFFSVGLLSIALFIFAYFIVVVVAETAQTGTPFGERFKNVWVPIRLVVALGLLLPMTHGINVGQYITLGVAKMGSGFATNGWNRYNSAIDANVKEIASNAATQLSENPTGGEILMARPPTPNIAPALQAISLAHACAYAVWHNGYHEGWDTDATVGEIDPIQFGGPSGNASKHYVKNPYFYIRPYLVKQPVEGMENQELFLDLFKDSSGTGGNPKPVTYVEALDFMGDSDILITFGARDPEGKKFKEYPGNIEPTCGQIRIPISDLTYKGCGETEIGSTADCGDSGDVGGSDYMQKFYFELVRDLWATKAGVFLNTQIPNTTGGGGGDVQATYVPSLVALTQRFVAKNMSTKIDVFPDIEFPDQPGIQTIACHIGCHLNTTQAGGNADIELPSCSKADAQSVDTKYASCHDQNVSSRAAEIIIRNKTSDVRVAIDYSWARFNSLQLETRMTEEMRNLGWGGAGVWYNKIQDVNGRFITAVTGMPASVSYPLIMERIYEERKKRDSLVSGIGKFDPHYSDNKTITALGYAHPGEATGVAQVLSEFYQFWQKDNLLQLERASTGSVFRDVIDFVFGTSGLGAMRGMNAGLHPLAQLSALGKGLVDSAIRNILAGFLGNSLPIEALLGKEVSSTVSIAADMLSSFAFIGLTAGVVLYYVLPFLPFVFFFFAVGSWVKAIFEAMVGVPLWALAHLRIDGEGLPGSSASNGYFLLFDIFIRPILTVFGLIASTLIFTAQVRILNFIWDLVIDNIAGFSGDSDDIAIVKDPTDSNSETLIKLKRDGVDQFFFTIIYTIIVYMLATASFKLIDEIPKNILRWMGAGVSAFGDINDDPTEGLTKYAAIGGITFGKQAIGAVNEAGKGLKKSIEAGGLEGGLAKTIGKATKS